MKPKTSSLILAGVLFLLLFPFGFGPLSPPSLALAPGSHLAERFIVVIDPGHGGHDPGAIGWLGLKEKDITLAIARLIELEAFLSEPQLKIVLTRRSDVYVPLKERVELASRLGAALYLSIHANAHGNPRVKGIETLLPESWRGRSRASLSLAKRLQRSLTRELGGPDRGVKYQRLYLRWSRVPAALVEVGFITNPEEARRLASLSYQYEIAQAILAGIKEFLGLPD